MTKYQALVERKAFQLRAMAHAEAGRVIQAGVWTLAADMCRAAWWADCFGTLEAERLVELHHKG